LLLLVGVLAIEKSIDKALLDFLVGAYRSVLNLFVGIDNGCLNLFVGIYNTVLNLLIVFLSNSSPSITFIEAFDD